MPKSSRRTTTCAPGAVVPDSAWPASNVRSPFKAVESSSTRLPPSVTVPVNPLDIRRSPIVSVLAGVEMEWEVALNTAASDASSG